MASRARATLAVGALIALATTAVPASADGKRRIRVTAAQATPTKFFYGGRGSKRRAVFEFTVRGRRRVDLRVDAISVASGEVVRSWRLKRVRRNEPQSLRWNGRTSGRTVAPEGRYSFRVRGADVEAAPAPSQGQSGGAPSGGSAPAEPSGDPSGSSSGGVSASRATSRAKVTAASGFEVGFYHHYFPVRGPHNFGSDGSKFGADRGDHSHQGHDVFAPCGAPVVAARAGQVKVAAFHARAGNYVVIDGADTEVDYVYMHLLEKPLVEPGQLVRTGQRIGLNGETGNAVGCHVHFELWRGGWYDGGEPFDPFPSLKRWDAFS